MKYEKILTKRFPEHNNLRKKLSKGPIGASHSSRYVKGGFSNKQSAHHIVHAVLNIEYIL